jgi:membrane fusion protein, macrolide-specific efflux system
VPFEVPESVDASDVGQIKAGDQVLITVGTATQNVFGTVSSVGIVASTTSGVASFPVVVAVTGSPAGVYPGATASLQIVYRQLSDVLLVPTLAINRANGATTVLVPNGGNQVRRTITAGLLRPPGQLGRLHHPSGETSQHGAHRVSDQGVWRR